MENFSLVVKSNALIEASYKLSLNEQRLILACISKVRRDDPITDKIMYSISGAEFSKICDTSPELAYRDLMVAAKELQSKKVTITQKPNGKERHKETLIANWVQSIKYSKGKGIISLRFNHDILQYLTDLNKCFTIYKLKNITSMSSIYGVRLYELLMQWQEIGEREVSIEWLRSILQLENKYIAIKDFKKRVLDYGVKDVNENSNLWVKWEQKKTGRKVTHLKFKFGKKEEKKQKILKSEIKINGIKKSIVESNARPGETYEQAALRIKKSCELL